MVALRVDVPVASQVEQVTARLDGAAADPASIVSWFTRDPSVRATVGRSDGGWQVGVVAPAFVADSRVTVMPHGSGSMITIDGDLAGRGLFSLATPALTLARSRIEDTARRTLHREFGDPAGSIR